MENDVLYNRIMNVVHEEYGEGSTAVANPEGEPTDDLTSIQIGDEIYGISGGGGGGMFVTMSKVGDDYVLDKTYAEIKTAIESGILPVMLTPQPELPDDGTLFTNIVVYYGYSNEKYEVQFMQVTNQIFTVFLADTEDGVLTLLPEE